ncbi:hypothetical protein D3C78_868820 [compost metagenome]|jgi:hypothetical protein
MDVAALARNSAIVSIESAEGFTHPNVTAAEKSANSNKGVFAIKLKQYLTHFLLDGANFRVTTFPIRATAIAATPRQKISSAYSRMIGRPYVS